MSGRPRSHKQAHNGRRLFTSHVPSMRSVNVDTAPFSFGTEHSVHALRSDSFKKKRHSAGHVVTSHKAPLYVPNYPRHHFHDVHNMIDRCNHACTVPGEISEYDISDLHTIINQIERICNRKCKDHNENCGCVDIGADYHTYMHSLNNIINKMKSSHISDSIRMSLDNIMQRMRVPEVKSFFKDLSDELNSYVS